MQSASHQSSKQDGSLTTSSIELELEQLLAIGDSGEGGEDIGTEALNDKPRKSKKIQYKHRADDSKETNEDSHSRKSAQSKKSTRSKRSYRDKNISGTSSRSKKYSTDGSLKDDDSKSPNPNRSEGSKSPKPNMNSRDSRKIKYMSKEPETTEERDRDHRSKDSKGSRVSRRSGHRKPNRSKAIASERTSFRKSEIPSHFNKDGVAKIDSKRFSFSKQKAMRRRSWSFDDFENNKWSSSEDEEDVEVGLNDKEHIEFGLNDEDDLGLNDADDIDDEDLLVASSGRDQNARRRRHIIRENKSIEHRRAPQGSLKRASSTGGLDARKHHINSRHPRRNSGAKAIEGDMILGDPSRRAPLSRSKSNHVFSSSLLQKRGGDRKAPPTRNESSDFAEYLRNQGPAQKPDQLMTRKHHSDHSSLESKGEDDEDNPFEVTYQSYNATNDWDPFASEDTAEEKLDDAKERMGNLRPTRSCRLLQNSSKDTISRLRVGANVRKASSISNMGTNHGASGDLPYSQGNVSASTGITNNSNDPGEASKTEREKQRRADYKKSIVAAAIVGRRLSSNVPRPQRQARTVRYSFEESVKQLEGALQSAR
jgi:hypothetical protein